MGPLLVTSDLSFKATVGCLQVGGREQLGCQVGHQEVSRCHTMEHFFGGKIISKWHYVDRSRSALFHSRDQLPILWLLFISNCESKIMITLAEGHLQRKVGKPWPHRASASVSALTLVSILENGYDADIGVDCSDIN